MSNLVSGMVLVTKAHGDLHYLITTPYGYKAIDVDCNCIEFDPDNYTKAYIPDDYADIWEAMPGTEIILGGN